MLLFLRSKSLISTKWRDRTRQRWSKLTGVTKSNRNLILVFLLFRPPSLPVVKAKKKSSEVKSLTRAATPSSDEEDDPYNSDEDPEWRNTPMAKRIRKLKEEDAPPKIVEPEAPDRKVSKRMSRSHCACRNGGCRSCICSKDKRPCTKDCGCAEFANCRNTSMNNTLVRKKCHTF